MRQLLLMAWLAAAAAGILSGCATGGSNPAMIVLSNQTGRDLRMVELMAPDKNGAHRVGQVSPVLKGAELEFARNPDSPPLPKSIIVRCVESGGKVWEQTVAVPRPGPSGVLAVQVRGANDVVIAPE